MKNLNLTTDLERDLYVEIIGTKRGLESYFEFAEENGYEHLDTFKNAKVRLEILTTLAEIIKKHTDEKNR